ncbi:MAG: hypothetical protein PHN68_08440 [Prolixibacteraceae bacterium]|nr:hypothetical protein [Prolixibacteraceae bacterium]
MRNIDFANTNLSQNPKLVYINETEAFRHVSLIKCVLIPILEKIKVEFLKLGIGPFTNEFLNDVLFDNCSLIKSQVPANKLAGLLIACKELQHPGRLELEILKDFPSIDESGEIILSDESVAAIREFNSIYAITAKGVELFEAHKRAAEALNEFYQLAKENIEPTPETLAELFLFDREGNIIPSPQEYDLFHYVTSPELQQQN